MATLKRPDLEHERALIRSGYARIAGLDEAGRGAWAGPVCAAAVALPLDQPDLLHRLEGVRDSKTLTPLQRERLFPVILKTAQAVGVGWGQPSQVDALGVVAATRAAMASALDALDGGVDALLIDHLPLPDVQLPQDVFDKADLHSLTVAAASIVAKVERDRLMIQMDGEYPGYGFAQHKGYGTRAHREALVRLGPTRLHRMSWQPLCELERKE